MNNFKDIGFYVEQDKITINTPVVLGFVLENKGKGDMEFLKNLTVLELHFIYGDSADAITEGDGSDIQVEASSPEWSVKPAVTPEGETYWRLTPEVDKIVWKGTGAKEGAGQLRIICRNITCNGTPGRAEFELRKKGMKAKQTFTQKYVKPIIKDFKPVTPEPYYIGERVTLGWTLPGKENWRVALDGSVLENQYEKYYEKETEVKDGVYRLTVENEAGCIVQEELTLKLEFIRKFEIKGITRDMVELEWDFEDKNLIDVKIPGLIESILVPKGSQSFSTITEADREFILRGTVRNSSRTVESKLLFKAPVIKHFSLIRNSLPASEGKGAFVQKDCSRLLEQLQQNRKAQQDMDFVNISMLSEECFTDFHMDCKSGPTYYHYTFEWSGENVLKYSLEALHSNGSYSSCGEYEGSSTGTTISVSYGVYGGRLTAEDEYGYIVEKEC